MAKRIYNYFKNRPGLTVLILLLALITAANLKPGLYFLGWDNYSSYFNLKTNIFRTFFATWRQYRGVGVPSDSESTDIFRQLIFLALSPFVKAQLLDQVYILASLWAGVILVYFLIRALFGRLHKNGRTLDLMGLVGAMVYLFNLNTLATFYFPMIMFVNRFYTVPLILLILANIIQKGKKAGVRDYFVFWIAVVATSGAYMTATVFITVLILLVLFLVFQPVSLKAKAGFLVLFIAFNSFWLFPFANYTAEKSKTVNDAPTFIEANEIQLNKPASFYAFDKQFILYPSFFDTAVNSLDGTRSAGYHPIIPLLNQPQVKTYVFFVALLGLAGSLMLLATAKKNGRYAWIPLTYFLFLILSFKAFSPLGPVYVYFEKHVPFFANLFRFGDTKFHYFIAFSGSLAAAYLAGFIALRTPRRILAGGAAVVFISGMLVYKSYTDGHFFGFFMRNQVPQAYFSMARIMNKDPRQGRVLHLPYDINGYWRSYSWGYLGSSFFHFMIDRPLLEKTFEPASADNAAINEEIFKRIANMQSVAAQGTGTAAVDRMGRYLNDIGVRYLIMDGTVSPQQPSKGLSLWGQFNANDAAAMVAGLRSQNWIREVARYPVSPADYLDTYEQVIPLTDEQISQIRSAPAEEIVLYELLDPAPVIRTAGNEVTLPAVSPFKDSSAAFNLKDGMVEATLGNVTLRKGVPYALSVPRPVTGQVRIEVFARTDGKNLILTFAGSAIPELTVGSNRLSDRTILAEANIPLSRIGPALGAKTPAQSFLSNWNQFGSRPLAAVRIKVGDSIMPLPAPATASQYVGAVTAQGTSVPFDILIPDTAAALSGNDFRLTDKPNCFGDAITDYSSSLKKEGSGISVTGQNGSTCFLADLGSRVKERDNYVEFRMDYEASNRDLDQGKTSSSKPRLDAAVRSLPKPNNLYACIKDEAVSDCFNTHQVLDLAGSGSVVVPTEKAFGAFRPLVMFALKNTGLQSQTLDIRAMQVTPYASVFQGEFELPFMTEKTYSFTPDKDSVLSLRFALPMDHGSFYQGPGDGFLLSNGVCGRPGAYRTFRKDAGGLLSYFSNCDNSFFTTVDFKSDNAYLWMLDYNLASGKFPRYVLGDGFFNYKNDFLSLGQGYPDIAGFKDFQYPETVFSNASAIKKELQSLELKHAYTVVPAYSEYEDDAQKSFTVSHDSENEGLALYRNFNIVPVPGSWWGMTVREAGSMPSQSAGQVSYRNILPSLWRIDSASPGSVIVFNESYDRQWGVYGSLGDLILGREAQNSHVRCNSYFNCFKIGDAAKARYIFYYPEKLNVIGWMITLLTGLLSILFIRYQRSHIRHT